MEQSQRAHLELGAGGGQRERVVADAHADGGGHGVPAPEHDALQRAAQQAHPSQLFAAPTLSCSRALLDLCVDKLHRLMLTFLQASVLRFVCRDVRRHAPARVNLLLDQGVDERVPGQPLLLRLPLLVGAVNTLHNT